MLLLKQILPGIIGAALLTGGLGAILAWLSRSFSQGKNGGWLLPIAVSIGFAGGHILAAGWPAFPPADATLWLFYFALLTGVIGALVEFIFVVPVGLRRLVWLIVFTGLMRLLLQPKFQYGWTHKERVLWWIASVVSVSLITWCLEKSDRHGELRLLSPLVATIVSAGTGVALMLSGSLLLGQLALVLAGVAGSSLLVAWFLADVSFRGAAPVVAILLASLLMSGYLYAELPAWSALCFAVAPILALVVPASSNIRLGPWKSLALASGLVVLPVVVAVFIAIRASPPMEY